MFNNRFISARCNIYISGLCYDVSVRLSVRLTVTEVHWRIIANSGFKFRSHFTAHCGRHAACGRIILRASERCIIYRVSCSKLLVNLLLQVSVAFGEVTD